MKDKKYFQRIVTDGKSVTTFQNVMFEIRAEVALRLISTYGAVAGKRSEKKGDTLELYELQTPKELVARCFSIADLFIDECEKRGLIKEMECESVFSLLETMNK